MLNNPKLTPRLMLTLFLGAFIWLIVAFALNRLETVYHVPKDAKLQNYIVDPAEFDRTDDFLDSDGQFVPELMEDEETVNLPELSNRLYAIQPNATHLDLDEVTIPLNTAETDEVQAILAEVADANSLSQIRRIVREYVRFDANPAYQIIKQDNTLGDLFIDRDGNLREDRLRNAVAEVYPPERQSEIYQAVVDNYDAETKIGNVKEIGIAPNLWIPNASFAFDNFDFGVRVPYPRITIASSEKDIPIYAVALAFALIELVLAFIFLNSDDKLVRSLTRVTGGIPCSVVIFRNRVVLGVYLKIYLPRKAPTPSNARHSHGFHVSAS